MITVRIATPRAESMPEKRTTICCRFQKLFSPRDRSGNSGGTCYHVNNFAIGIIATQGPCVYCSESIHFIVHAQKGIPFNVQTIHDV